MLQDVVAAGPLRIDVRELETRSIRSAGVELVRRTYFAVRDPAWGSVEPKILTRELERSGGGFRLQARCRYCADPIGLDALVEISATGDGLVRFASTATATSAFAYNRIGFCILHPPAELAGATLRLDGAETITIPSRVLPQLRAGDVFAPAAGPFSRLVVTGASGARVEFRFAGDEFELEDQRNWTDGSFKTYGTPLALGPPPPLAPGDQLTQSIELRLLEPPRRRPPAAATPELRPAQETTLPRIGFASGSAAADADLARRVRPAHLRVDLRDGLPELERTIRLAAALGSGVQVALHLPLADAERDDLAAARFGGLLRSVLVLRRDAERLTGEEDVEDVRVLLGAAADGARLWTGTDAYYAQLNRGLHDEPGTPYLTFSMHPQEHAADEESIVETLEIQRDVVLDLKAQCPGCRVSLGAVTLGARRSFSAPPGVVAPDPAPDPRQSSRFGAVWSLASVRYLAEAGVEEVTYHSLAGAGGLIDADGEATALLQLFADLAELGDRATILESREPLRCAGLAFRSGDSLVFLVGNLRAEPLRVRLHGDVLDLEPYDYVRLEVPR